MKVCLWVAGLVCWASNCVCALKQAYHTYFRTFILLFGLMWSTNHTNHVLRMQHRWSSPGPSLIRPPPFRSCSDLPPAWKLLSIGCCWKGSLFFLNFSEIKRARLQKLCKWLKENTMSVLETNLACSCNIFHQRMWHFGIETYIVFVFSL